MTSKCLLVNMMAVYFSLIDVYVPSGRVGEGYMGIELICKSIIHILRTGMCGIGREDKVYRIRFIGYWTLYTKNL